MAIGVRMTTGLALLKKAFPKLLDLGSMPAGGREGEEFPWESTTKVKNLPIFTEGDFFGEDFENQNFPNPVKIDASDVNKKPHHVLAWYQPYRFFGPGSWGIYFNLPEMMAYCEQVTLAVPRSRSDIPRHSIYNLVWAQVARHELEHAIHELVLAQAVIDHGTSPYMFPAKSDSAINFEGLATHYEFADYLSKAPYSGMYSHGFVSDIVKLMPLPLFYDDWDTIDVQAVEATISKLLGGLSIEAFSNFRNLLGAQPKSKFLNIPLFLVDNQTLPYGNMGPWMRAYGFDCKKTQDALSKPYVLQSIHPDLYHRAGSRHEIVLNMTSKPGSIPVSCHNKDQLHTDLLRQISEMTQVPKSQVQQVLRDSLRGSRRK